MNAKAMLLALVFALALTSAAAVDVAPAAHKLEQTLHTLAVKVNAAQLRVLGAHRHHVSFSAVRGRELVEANTCEWHADDSTCELDPLKFGDYKPATEEGQGMMDYLVNPMITCFGFKTQADCVGICQWDTDDKECNSNEAAIQTKCDDKDKKPVTLLSFMATEEQRCGSVQDAAACGKTKECTWMGNCVPDTEMSMMGMMGVSATSGKA